MMRSSEMGLRPTVAVKGGEMPWNAAEVGAAIRRRFDQVEDAYFDAQRKSSGPRGSKHVVDFERGRMDLLSPLLSRHFGSAEDFSDAVRELASSGRDRPSEKPSDQKIYDDARRAEAERLIRDILREFGSV